MQAPSSRLLLSFALLLAIGVGRAGEPPPSGRDPQVRPLDLGKPLIAYWTFDEPSGTLCRDAAGNRCDASPKPGSASGLERAPSVFGGGLCLAGKHMLQVPGKPELGTLPKIAFSAWVLPTEMDRYAEIFRKEDGSQRVLFSFQEHGTVLSLGLNVNGYVECHAAIDPQRLMDGTWHHCAATFDGQFMRVYLDGRQVGELPRPGEIRAGGSAPGCIGSAHGNECLQGQLDELRIYCDALTAEEVARLFQNGCQSLASQSELQERLGRQVQVQVRAIYVRGTTFAQTLAQCRQAVIEQGLRPGALLIHAAMARLQADFPDDYDRFLHCMGTTPSRYLTARGNDFHLREVGRLVELMLEYKPLTEHQWASQTPEQRRKWQEAEAIRKEYETLKAQGDASQFSPGWIDIALRAGLRIQFRPQQREAVAPYVTPETPETRSLTAAEAQDALRRDWLHQAQSQPTPERIKAEIGWTRRLADRIGREHPGRVDFGTQLARLAELEKQAATLVQPDHELYFQVRQVKRSVALANPVIDFEQMLFVDVPFPQGSEWRHETRHRLGYMAVPGGRLLVLNGLSPAGKLRQLLPQAPLHGSFWRPDLSWDARKVLVSFKPHNEKSFHLYELGIDGRDLVQLTDGPYDDFDPIYLPDDQHIMFSTTRGHTYVRCMPPTNAFVLARCDRDGRNVYLISANNEPDYLPSVMNDGRVIYTRWEYTDKPLWRAQKLWTINPDGTQVSTVWGNQSVWPDLLKDARAIPGSRRVMFTGSAHHNWFSGSVGIIDPERGLNFPHGLTKVTADVPWPECGNGPVDPVECADYHASGEYAAYYSPYPLGERDFLVSAERGGKFVLYLMDVEGNRELIYEGTHNIFYARPLRPRVQPPVLADRVAWPDRAHRLEPEPGVIYSSNVYQGAPAELRGKAKYLRVWHIDPKTYTYWNRRPYLSTGPVVSMVQSEGVKRILGTVPIEGDGSVAFHAPPGKALHFQLLDEQFRALQTMRSFVGVMPGEYRGCLGCHESHSRTPVLGASCLALLRPASRIEPPPWSDDTVSYPRYVRPVLDKYCGKCHQGEGEGRKALDLTDRPGFLQFSEPYVVLIGRPSWGQPYQAPPTPVPGWGIAGMLMVEAFGKVDPVAYQTPRPMSGLSLRSRLIDLCSSGKHYDVKVDALSLQRLIAWVDAMCPYCGDEEVRSEDDPVFPGVDWLAVRPKLKTAPRIVRPGPVD